MAKISREEREAIAETRLLRILARHGIATARTLEQKISDAGPYGQRIDPHILTTVRNRLVVGGTLVRSHHSAPWFNLSQSSPEFVASRLAEQLPVYEALSAGTLSRRMGQPLEIATYRALCEQEAEFYGRYKDLDEHEDSQLYKKEEPPQHIGKKALPGAQNLDFLFRHPEAGPLGIECKNVREWLYPDRDEISELLVKCLALDCVPVLIARRIPFVTFRLLSTCGVIMHQTYNQLFPASEPELAARARDKNLLAYHDIRTGNIPDDRLLKFITVNMPLVAVDARDKFDTYKDLLSAFASGDMAYEEFAARVRRRRDGVEEDNDFEGDPADW